MGASFTFVTVRVKLFVTAFTPPAAVPPLSVTITLMTAVPLALVTVRNDSVPVVRPA